MRKSMAEAESTLFWTVANEMRVALKNKADETIVVDLIDEIETILLYTESDVIRKRCRELLAAGRRNVRFARHGAS